MSKYDELIKSYDRQSADLRSFLTERGDNLVEEDLEQANLIEKDLHRIKDEIGVCEQARSLLKSADEARSFLDAPARDHTHPAGTGGAKVLGATKAGESVFYRPDGTLKRNRALQLVRETGAGSFGKQAFDAAQQPEYRNAFRAMMKGRTGGANFRLLEEGIDSQGGYLAPVEIIAKLIEKKPAPTSVSSFCDTINTGRDAVSLPRVNYTGASDDSDGSIYTTGVRVTLTDENPTSDTQSQVNDANIFGSVRVAVYTWMLQCPLTLNVLEDATFDPLSWISGKFGETIAQHKDKMCIIGDPSGGPVGFLTNPGATDTLSSIPVIKTGLAAEPFLTTDSIINMTEDLPTQYDANVRYLYRRRTTGKRIRTFKDATGRYMFGAGVQDSGLEPARGSVLNGYPVSWSDYMPDAAANAFPVVAGDFSGVTIVNRIGISIQILREIAARKNQVIVIGRIRFGVQVLEPWKLRALSCSV